MAQIIARLFSSPSNAAAAAKDVQDYRVGDNEVFTIEGAPGGEPGARVSDVAATG